MYKCRDSYVLFIPKVHIFGSLSVPYRSFKRSTFGMDTHKMTFPTPDHGTTRQEAELTRTGV